MRMIYDPKALALLEQFEHAKHKPWGSLRALANQAVLRQMAVASVAPGVLGAGGLAALAAVGGRRAMPRRAFLGLGAAALSAVPWAARAADVQLNTLGAPIRQALGEALPRTSVKSFGAVGNGTTNDLTAFQNAIDSVSGAGGIVFVPGSSAPYLLGGTLNMKANVILAGEYAGSILMLADDANVDMIVATGALPHIGLRDLIIYGNRAQQNGDATKHGINWNISNTTAGYTANSTVNGLGPTALVDPFHKNQNLLVMMVDGPGIRAVGAHGLWQAVDVLNTTGPGILAQANDTQWVSVNAGATAHEGWLCAGGSARYTDTKAFFCGTGLVPGTPDTYGNYLNGHGYRVTSRGQHFVNPQAQDLDGWGFSVQAHDISIQGAYIDQACQLPEWSTFLGQSPVRGGGFVSTHAGINLQGADDCNISCQVTSRGVVNGDISAVLAGIVRLNGSSNNNVMTVSYTTSPAILAGAAPEVVEDSYTGAGNQILTKTGLLVP